MRAVPTRPVVSPRCRQLANSSPPSPGECGPPLQCAAATIPAAPARSPAVSFPQDIAHVDAGYPCVRINVLDQSLPLAGFQVIIIGRFWVITEGMEQLSLVQSEPAQLETATALLSEERRRN